jgi:VanZ family protein
MKQLSFVKFIPAIIWFSIVLVLMCLPKYDLPRVNDWFHKIYGDKLIHVGMFGLLAFLFMWPVVKSSLSVNAKTNYFLKTAIAVSVWGLTTEFIQKFFIYGRSFDLLDWAGDTLGALIAWVIVSKRLKKAN